MRKTVLVIHSKQLCILGVTSIMPDCTGFLVQTEIGKSYYLEEVNSTNLELKYFTEIWDLPKDYAKKDGRDISDYDRKVEYTMVELNCTKEEAVAFVEGSGMFY